MARDQVQRVAPLKLKLSLSSASSLGPPSTPTQPSTSQPAGPSKPLPSTPLALHTPATATPASTKSSAKKSGAKAKPKPAAKSASKPKVKPKASLAATPRPTAIPSRLLSSGPTTPRSNTSSLPSIKAEYPVTPAAAALSQEFVLESEDDDEEDPLSLPLSPQAGEINAPTPKLEVDDALPSQPATPAPILEGQDALPFQFATPEPKRKEPPKWQRLKKPLKELLNKTLVELRRRDEYDLFGGPVNPEDFPGYLDIVGGEENMMDLGTMQQKVDDGDYRSMDQFETDLQKLVDAAIKFNPIGTVPHNAAKRLHTYGSKFIERFRPIVKTPSPSPEREISATPARGQSTFSGRETTAQPTTAIVTPVENLPPRSRIPIEMLAYPANSLPALAVGWNLTGGRRVYPKRLIRGRERFTGKWRNWDLDGSRDLAEMDDLDEWFDASKRLANETSLRKPDWLRIRKESNWWDYDLGGQNGQPPIPFQPYPTPPTLKQRSLGVADWGPFPEIDAETRLLAAKSKVSDEAALATQLRPDGSIKDRKPIRTQPYVNVYDGHLDIQPQEVLTEVLYGDVLGEAYARSIQAFVDGAEKMTAKAKIIDTDQKPDPEVDEHRISLSEWIRTEYRGGAVQSGPLARSRRVLQDLYGPDSTSFDKDAALQIAKDQYAREALKRMSDYKNELDILPLLKERSEFMYPGITGRPNVGDSMAWVCKEIPRLNEKVKAGQLHLGTAGNGKRKREDGDKDEKEVTNSSDAKKVKIESTESVVASAASSPLTQPPGTPVDDSSKPAESATQAKPETPAPPAENPELKKLRTELSALSKFYPLHALKKMSAADAERLLPQNVRGLMSKKV